MPSEKAAYLAAHYLSTDKPTRKRKRKNATKSDGLIIADDDDDFSRRTYRQDEDEAPTVSGTSTEFRKAKKSGWQNLGRARDDVATPQEVASDAAAADAIIASAAADRAAADAQDDAAEAPVLMTDGTRAGLVSAAMLAEQLRQREAADREELARLQAMGADARPAMVMRDATGRKVDVATRREELRRARQEAERAEEAKRRLLRGEVQLAEARRRKEELEDAALMPLARGREDVEMNTEMKAAERWNDPMTRFMAEGDGAGRKKNGAKDRRPVYKGAAPPNRYSIRPGYRWDGVDRGNGFEAERFKAISRRERNKNLDYAWQMDE